MAQARAKIILAGEHAVVYGHPAIAQPIDLEVRIHAIKSLEPGLVFLNPKMDPQHKSDSLFAQVQPKLVSLFGDRVEKLVFEIDSDIPGGCGLGSSAALSVGLIRAALEHFGESGSPEEIALMALELEKIFHGNPSGVDHTVIAHEDLIWFQNGQVEKINAYRPLKFSIMMASPHAGTRAVVEAVRQRRLQDEVAVNKIFSGISEIVFSMRSQIEQGNLREMGLLMNRNQRLLKQLGVSTPELDQLCEQAIQNGALGAKLTGAGGGGCVIALFAE